MNKESKTTEQQCNKQNVNGSASIEDWYYEEDDDYEGNDECCDECGCYHGHNPWCSESDEDNDF